MQTSKIITPAPDFKADPGSAGAADADAGAAPRKVPAGFLTRAALESLPEPEWLVEDTLQERTVSEIFGEFGVGKTIFTLDIALCVATGKPWHGRPVLRRRVVYVYSEGPESLRQRVAAWERKYNGGRQVPEDWVLFLPLPVDLTDQQHRQRVIKAILSWASDVGLVVFDTLYQCSGDADLNTNKEMKRITGAINVIRAQMPTAHVLLVHHDTKAGTSSGFGSVMLPGVLSSLFKLEKKDDALRFVCHKQRNEAPWRADATFMLEETPIGTDRKGRQVRSVVVQKLYDGLNKGAKAATAARDNDIVAALADFGDEGATSSQWLERCRSKGIKIASDDWATRRDGLAADMPDSPALAEERLVAKGKWRWFVKTAPTSAAPASDPPIRSKDRGSEDWASASNPEIRINPGLRIVPANDGGDAGRCARRRWYPSAQSGEGG